MTDHATPNTFTNGTEADATQVNANFAAIAAFLNSTGVHVYQAGTIENAALENLTITGAKIAAGTITADKVAADVATQAELDAVSSAYAAADSDHVTATGAHAATKISVDSTTLSGVGTTVQASLEELDDAIAAVVSGGVAAGTITSSMILDGTIATDDIADSAITTAKIADGTIASGDLSSSLAQFLVPTGAIIGFGLTSAQVPSGWIACDGSAVTVASGNTTLRTALITAGSPYGVSGSDPRVPDSRGRVEMGAGTGAGEDSSGAAGTQPSGTALTARTLGQWAGAQDANIAVNELPTHTHSISDVSGSTGIESANHTHGAGTLKGSINNGSAGGGSGNTAVMATSTGTFAGAMTGDTAGVSANHTHSFSGASGTASTISGHTGQTALSKLQPYIVVNKIIKT